MNTGLVDQLRNLSGESIIAISIRNAAEKVNNQEELNSLCRMIRSQAMDNWGIMEAIMGSQLLKECL